MASNARRRWLRPWLILPLAVIVGIGAWLAFKPGKSTAAATAPTATARTVAVTTGTMQQTISSSGTIEPESTEDLSFSSAGTVTAVDVKAGDTVKIGAVLATIDSAALQQSVASAQATVDTATAKLTDDEDAAASDAQITADYADLASANAALTTATTNLAGASLTSPIAGKVSEVNLTVGEQLGSNGTAGTGITGTGTGSGRSSSTLGSDSTGAGGGNGSSSSSSSSSDGTIEVISTGLYNVTVGIDSTQIKSVKVGQTANVTPTTSSSSGTGNGFGGGGFARILAAGGFGGGAGGFGGGGNATGAAGGTGAAGAGGTTATTTPAATGSAVTGLVTSVGAVATATSGVATFPVVVTIGGNPTGFNAGGSATVDIVYSELKNVVEVPSFAVTTTNGTSTVTVEAGNGKKSTRTITTGQTVGGETQVLSGVKVGENVVISFPGVGGNRTGAGAGGTFTGFGGAGGGATGATRTGAGG